MAHDLAILLGLVRQWRGEGYVRAAVDYDGYADSHRHQETSVRLTSPDGRVTTVPLLTAEAFAVWTLWIPTVGEDFQEYAGCHGVIDIDLVAITATRAHVTRLFALCYRAESCRPHECPCSSTYDLDERAEDLPLVRNLHDLALLSDPAAAKPATLEV